MAFKHGKATVFKMDNSAGSLTDLSAYMDEVGFPRETEAAETTTFGKQDKTYIVGLSDSSFSCSGKADVTCDGVIEGARAALSAGTIDTVSFEYGPSGSATGQPKYSGEALITSYEQSSPVGDVVTFSLALQVTGVVTRGTW
jgi:hypothetical protein